MAPTIFCNNRGKRAHDAIALISKEFLIGGNDGETSKARAGRAEERRDDCLLSSP